MHPILNHMLAQARDDDLRRKANGRRFSRVERSSDEESRTVTMRVAHSGEQARMRGVAARELPRAPVLVGELAGRTVAVLSLADGGIVASRGIATGEVVALLELRAAQLRQRA